MNGRMPGVSQRTAALKLPQFLTGAVLLCTAWPLNWLLSDESRRTSYLFFPLWLGYILVMDGLVTLRNGTSMLNRSARAFAGLFLASAPCWWLFEVINWRTRNWQYLGGQVFTGFEYLLLSTLSFSTVMPAVFETAELVRSFRWAEWFASGPRLRPTTPLAVGMVGAGLGMLTLIMTWPKLFYPFVWGAVFLIFEPVNWLARRQSFFDRLQHGDWRPVISLSVGALICGFFWEMWNYYSYPKWIYHTPGAEYLHVFEMPLLGYIGYMPFAWELYALRNFLWPYAPALRL